MEQVEVIKKNLADAFIAWHGASGNTQTKTAELTKITQPRLSNLMKGKLERFSIESLITLCITVGVKVEVVVGEIDVPQA